jgi:hypothetical protein
MRWVEYVLAADSFILLFYTKAILLLRNKADLLLHSLALHVVSLFVISKMYTAGEHRPKHIVLLQADQIGFHNKDGNYPKKRCLIVTFLFRSGFYLLLSLFTYVSSTLAASS